MTPPNREPTVDEAKVDAILSALADPTRRAVVELLGGGPRRAGELARATGVPPARMSRHLKVLLETGIAFDERIRDDARARIFHMHKGSLDPIRHWLDELQAHWDAQLQSFKKHVETRVDERGN